MSREDCAPGAIIAVFINCFVDGSRRCRRLGVMGVYAADVHSLCFSGAGIYEECWEGDSRVHSRGLCFVAGTLSPRMPAEGLILTTR